MKKYFYFVMLFLYVIGTINGIGYSIYIHEYVTAHRRGSAGIHGMAYRSQLLQGINGVRRWR